MSIITNALSAVAQRMGFLGQFFGGGLDAKRTTAWATYGYPDHIEFADYYKAYSRTGSGHGSVNKLIAKCWENQPKVYEGSDEQSDDARKQTAWEKEVNDLLNDPKLLTFKRLVEFDLCQMVGHYGALIYQVADGQKWDQPLKKGKLVRLIPAFESQIEPSAWDENEASPTFGFPTMYNFTTSRDLNNGTSNKQAQKTYQVHASRVLATACLKECQSFALFTTTLWTSKKHRAAALSASLKTQAAQW